jgi:toxin ParE1/3/4
MDLPFITEAADELEEAALWYERERTGYGVVFTSAVARVVARAARLPKTGAPVPDTSAERDVRRFLVRRFPYSVVVALVVGQPAVIAVVHGHREFGYWRDRL